MGRPASSAGDAHQGTPGLPLAKSVGKPSGRRWPTEAAGGPISLTGAGGLPVCQVGRAAVVPAARRGAKGVIPNDVESLPFEAGGPTEPDDRLDEVRMFGQVRQPSPDDAA